MGLRGKGAKPKGGRQQTGGDQAETPRPWERKGLSRAERVIKFIETELVITAGEHAGRPFKLRRWQKRFIRAVYATGRNRRRKVRTAVLSMARKNGKSALAAALCLAHLVGPECEERGQCYSAAADRDQASLIFNELEALIQRVPWIEERVNVKRFTKEIEDLTTGSIYKALSSDAKTKHGFSASFIIYDELAQAPNRTLFDVLTTSTGARAEPLTIVISTQAADDFHVMSELIDYGLAVQREEVEDPTFHLELYAAPEGADLLDEDAWQAANPALGDFRSLEEMRTAAQQAVRIPSREPAVRNLYLNQRVEAEERFIPAAEWDACADSYTERDLRGRPCFGGLDLGSTRDLTSLGLYFPHDGGALLSWSWCPGDNLREREERDRVPYRQWADKGLIEPTPGRGTDKRYVALRLAEIAAVYDVQLIGFDRWSMAELERILAEEGIDLPLQPFGQGYREQGPAVRALEEAILNRTLRHNANPLLTWAVSNVVPNTDPTGAVKLDKDRARERIDPVVAAVMAIGLAAREPERKGYDFSGDRVLAF